MRVLVVEDETRMSRLLKRGLEEEGHAVDLAADGPEGLWLATENSYAAIVLDVMLPGFDGFELCHRLRAAGVWAPVLMLTARDGVDDRVRGLDAGADDYIVKPFALEELLARVRALLRRRFSANSPILEIGELRLDTVARTVERGGRQLTLSAREYALLEYLARRRGHVVSRAEIWLHVFPGSRMPASNVVDVYVGYL